MNIRRVLAQFRFDLREVACWIFALIVLQPVCFFKDLFVKRAKPNEFQVPIKQKPDPELRSSRVIIHPRYCRMPNPFKGMDFTGVRTIHRQHKRFTMPF